MAVPTQRRLQESCADWTPGGFSWVSQSHPSLCESLLTRKEVESLVKDAQGVRPQFRPCKSWLSVVRQGSCFIFSSCFPNRTPEASSTSPDLRPTWPCQSRSGLWLFQTIMLCPLSPCPGFTGIKSEDPLLNWILITIYGLIAITYVSCFNNCSIGTTDHNGPLS